MCCLCDQLFVSCSASFKFAAMLPKAGPHDLKKLFDIGVTIKNKLKYKIVPLIKHFCNKTEGLLTPESKSLGLP